MREISSDLERHGIDSNIVETLPSLDGKSLVDFVNGLSVAADHSRVQRSRDGLFSRVSDSFSGKGKRRQDEINASLIEGLEGSLKWLSEVTRETSKNSYAIAQVNNRLTELRVDLASVADFNRARAEEVDIYIANILSHLSQNQSRIEQVDLRVRARESLEFVMDRWTAGSLRGLSPMARCYATLEELRWGAFGDFMRLADAGDKQDWCQNLIDKLASKLARDVDKAVDERVVLKDYWLLEPTADGAATTIKRAIRYLGDWSDPSDSPFVYMTSQTPDYMPAGIPRIGAAERVAIGLASDVFEDLKHDE